MLKDELDLDGRPNLNLASFVGTYMEREAEALMVENLSKKYDATFLTRESEESPESADNITVCQMRMSIRL